MVKLKIIMKVCILGNGLVSLTLAKALINEGIYVDIISNRKKIIYSKDRSLGISRSNITFFNKNITNIDKLLWDIKKIEILSESLKNKKILDFEDNNYKLFSTIKNYKLYDLLLMKIKKSKFLNFKKRFKKDQYELIINCDSTSDITKKFFSKNFYKDYESYAYSSIIKHQKIKRNNIATQVFTKNGPLAFLPISENSTSIVYSCRANKKIDFKNEIKRYNVGYKIIKFSRISTSKLKFLILRSYFHKNILAFGDLLHKLHPLAGQGFNMSVRDIKELLRLIKLKKENGLNLDSSICSSFEKNFKHKNYLFSNGIDFIYETFKFESKINTNILSKSLSLMNKNKRLSRIFTKFADNGIIF